jgi:hypothetical protein
MDARIRRALSEAWDFLKAAAEPNYLALVGCMCLGAVFGVGMLLMVMVSHSCGGRWTLW